jgi:glycosyltransferase involved in cell wall biosynthesis
VPKRRRKSSLHPLLAEQDYPDFEIILIDDASSDDTLEVLEGFEKQYSNIRLVKVQNNKPSGKQEICNDLRDKICKKRSIYCLRMPIATQLQRMDYRNEFAVYHRKTIVWVTAAMRK